MIAATSRCDIWPQGVAKSACEAHDKLMSLRELTAKVAPPSSSAIQGLALPVLRAAQGNRRSTPLARRVLAKMVAPVRQGQAQAAARNSF